MAFCKNHAFLYFDNLRRTEKAETVLCLIHASYQAKIKKGNKDDIVRMLKNAYELFRFTAGTYTGESASQFSSQYTIGHELGIWINSDLELCSLALKVARNEITITDYFDIFFLNYIQPIDNKINHPLFSTLDYAQKNHLTAITKNDLKTIYNFVSQPENNNINGLFNMFIGSSYFSKIDDNTLKINYPIDDILNCCNLEYLNTDLDVLNTQFSDLKSYVNYLTTDHRSIDLIKDKFHFDKNEPIVKQVENQDLKKGYNKIYYGIPGCGKSYYIENTVLDGVDKKNNVFRTTFYLDYSNSDFIGQIYPVVDDDDKVKYEPIPGPFTKALERALTNKGEMIYLVIEEINRGNAAAIFGDTFQLLDRLKENKNGRVIGDSEYPISNAFIEDYLRKQGVEFTPVNIYIPHNLTLLATMNTSDQNVFPLDTAFKRRWNREKVTSDWGDENKIKKLYIPYSSVTWETFVKTINKEMIDKSAKEDAPISEDKQMGAYFADESMLTKDPNEKDGDKIDSFANNVLDYLFNDVTKFNHKILFEEQILTTDKIYERIDAYKKEILEEPDNVGAEQAESQNIFSEIFTKDISNELVGNAKKVDDDND